MVYLCVGRSESFRIRISLLTGGYYIYLRRRVNMVSGLHVSVDVRHRLYKDLNDFQQLTLLVYDLSILSILHDTHSVGKENILISILKI